MREFALWTKLEPRFGTHRLQTLRKEGQLWKIRKKDKKLGDLLQELSTTSSKGGKGCQAIFQHDFMKACMGQVQVEPG